MTATDARPPRRPRTWLKRLALGAAAAAAVWLLASYAIAYRLTRRAVPPFEEPPPSGMEPHRLTTADGESVGTWYVEGRPGKPIVIIVHGNGGCRLGLLSEAKLATSAGCGALLVTARAHGDSTGDVNDIGFGAAEDVMAAVAWVERHRAGRPVIVWGQSLGSVAALFAAKRLGGRVCGYILECPYRDLRTAVYNRLEMRLPFGLRDVAAAGLMTVAPLVLRDVNAISPLAASEGMPEGADVLILAGTADRRAKPEEARAIHERIPRSRLLVVEGGDHLALAEADPAGYREAILGFLGDARHDR